MNTITHSQRYLPHELSTKFYAVKLYRTGVGISFVCRRYSYDEIKDFLKRAVLYFGYQPRILQTDNGSEFTHLRKTSRIHPLDMLCKELGICHKRIQPRTPWHNGKVERSHRNDQERFYNFLSFYSYKDLLIQTKRYLNRSNNILMQVLGWKSPLEKRLQLETQ